MKKIIIGIVLFLAIVLSYAWFSKDNLIRFYQNFNGSVLQLSTIDLKKAGENFQSSILAPTPLRVFTKENQAVLVKEKVIAQTNIARFDNGMLPPLTENEVLDKVALKKAQDMFSKQYFEHVSPDGIGPGDLASGEGYKYIVEGENLILGNFKDEKEMLDLWMNSPGHRANILHEQFSEIGVAVIKGQYQGETVWIGVQEFGSPLSLCQEPDIITRDKITTDKHQLDDLAKLLDAKKVEIDNTSQATQRHNILVDEYNALAKKYNEINQQTKKIIAEYNMQIDAFNQCVAEHSK